VLELSQSCSVGTVGEASLSHLNPSAPDVVREILLEAQIEEEGWGQIRARIWVGPRVRVTAR
jgi:hypothetical protein